MIFHRHRWEVLSKTYAAPVGLQFGEIRGGDSVKEATKHIMGVTSVLVKCSCGEIKTFELLGQEIKGVLELRWKPEEKKA